MKIVHKGHEYTIISIEGSEFENEFSIELEGAHGACHHLWADCLKDLEKDLDEIQKKSGLLRRQAEE